MGSSMAFCAADTAPPAPGPVVPPPPTTLGGRTHWTMAGRRLSPYRSRASRRRKLPPNFARPTAIAHAPGERCSTGRCTARLPRTTRSKTNDPQCPYPTPRPFYESAVADKVLRKDNRFGGDQLEPLNKLAAELVALGPDAIVTVGTRPPRPSASPCRPRCSRAPTR
jgi:hypothetical protein